MKALNDSINEFCVLKSRGTSVGSSPFHPLIMTHSRDKLALSNTPFWFCLKTKPKHEHLAATALRRQLQIPCFSPRLRFRKATRRGAVWFVEAMFPGYLFAQFVYSLQDLYSRVRSFVFVADVGEVTESFRTNDVKEALDVALKGDIINVYAHSDFGRSFRSFVGDHMGAVNKRTTVIVLGDARNNYNLPHDWCLREIRQRAKRVIWLNPESRNTWGFGDSEMERYAIHCDLVEECRNLNQLYRVIDQLVPR